MSVNDGQATVQSTHPTGFVDSVRTVFSKFATFSGRAKRPEFWYFMLFNLVVGLVLFGIDGAIVGFSATFYPISTIYALLVLIPTLAVAARRFHDMGHSGWWQLLGIVPLIGAIIIFVWCARRGEDGPNKYGPA